MPETVVRTRALTRTYVKGGETVHACDGIDLEVPAGEFLVIPLEQHGLDAVDESAVLLTVSVNRT